MLWWNTWEATYKGLKFARLKVSEVSVYLWLDDLQEARNRGGWSLQGSRRSKRVRSLGPDIPWRTHPTTASLPAPRLISQGSISSQYCLLEKQTFNMWALWEYTLYTIISFSIKELSVNPLQQGRKCFPEASCLWPARPTSNTVGEKSLYGLPDPANNTGSPEDVNFWEAMSF